MPWGSRLLIGTMCSSQSRWLNLSWVTQLSKRENSCAKRLIETRLWIVRLSAVSATAKKHISGFSHTSCVCDGGCLLFIDTPTRCPQTLQIQTLDQWRLSLLFSDAPTQCCLPTTCFICLAQVVYCVTYFGLITHSILQG